MKQSMRARRMAKQHKRHKSQAKLNLVSLMDIFTIIVFFLLMSSSDVEILQNQKTIELPKSVSEKKPDSTLVVMIDAQNLMLGGEIITPVDQAMSDESPTIEKLTLVLEAKAREQALLELSTKATTEVADDSEPLAARAITIMGDKSVPYALLKKVMTTCAAAQYTKISLAVTKIESATMPSESGVINSDASVSQGGV